MEILLISCYLKLYPIYLPDKNNSFFSVTFNYTGYPMIRELRQRVANGEFGKIKQIQAAVPSLSSASPPPASRCVG